ncbi:lysylphosphatidylglycerol synthase transmembrane domain-containing protein [Pontibacter sp. SGAir0037]|uniref:lysylphosphatidylglycerol synthase transmembrane domain-containing protein n=1 Tax=Pontibacter sp. SGAir0037 TaxID=2571030 RepID=UPI0010CD2674|nr:lysylphosphatidylglycerol synthase transmembrane domain-containing protein [Pontibacter sp. SGAir0037]QCR22391.1 TIGR00374 family protein [Pontibacter sp. SGAir0037]
MALNEQKLQEQFSLRKVLLPMLLGLGIVAYMLYRNYEPAQLQILRQASPLWLAITLLVLFIRDFGYVYRIRSVTDQALSWRQSFSVIMLWEFASCALPSVVGGSTVAAFMLMKERIPLGKSIAQVMVTAMLDNLYFVVSVPVVLVMVGHRVVPAADAVGEAIQAGLTTAFAVSYLLVTVYAFLMAYALLLNPRAVKRLLLRLSRSGWLRRWRLILFNQANELLIASQHLRRKGAGYWWRAGISTAFVWTARYAIIGCLIAAFTHLDLQEHILLFSRNLIYKIVLMMSVTPGAAGVAEIAFPAFFGMFLGGFTTIIVLLYRLLTYYLYLLMGALVFPRWASRVFSQSRTKADQAVVPVD